MTSWQECLELSGFGQQKAKEIALKIKREFRQQFGKNMDKSLLTVESFINIYGPASNLFVILTQELGLAFTQAGPIITTLKQIASVYACNIYVYIIY